jgi:hypothetical protein
MSEQSGSRPEVQFYNQEAAEYDVSQPSSWYGLGHRIWVFQAFQALKDRGFACSLVDRIPETGIVLIHRSQLPDGLQLKRERFLIVIQGDNTPAVRSNIDIIQNSEQSSNFGRPACYIPSFPQPGLIARNVNRGSRFENVSYMGVLHGVNRSTILGSSEFLSQVESLGLKLEKRMLPDQWADYSEVDAVLAARDLGSHHHHKPAAKLTNAWLAGVPAILGPESAYRSVGCPGKNYLEICSSEEALDALRLLQRDPGFRQRIVDCGAETAGRFTYQAVADCWARFLEDVVFPGYYSWRLSRGERVGLVTLNLAAHWLIDRPRFLIGQRGIRGTLGYISTRIRERLDKSRLRGA